MCLTSLCGDGAGVNIIAELKKGCGEEGWA